MAKKQKLYSLPAAADIVGVNERNLRRAVAAGAVPSQRIGRNYAVTLQDVEAWRDNPDAHKAGPKPSAK